MVKLQEGGKEYYAAAHIERDRKISKQSNEQIEGQAVEFDEDQSKEVKKLWSKMTPEFAEGRRQPDPGVGSDMVPPSVLSGQNSALWTNFIPIWPGAGKVRTSWAAFPP